MVRCFWRRWELSLFPAQLCCPPAVPGAMARRALKAVLVDLNGTLHVEDSAVPGAQEALKRQVFPSFFFGFPLGGCVGAVCTKGWVSGPNPLPRVNARRSQQRGEIWCHLSPCCFPQCLFLCFLSLYRHKPPSIQDVSTDSCVRQPWTKFSWGELPQNQFS